MHSLYRSETLGPEDDSVESKHVALISHYMFNITITTTTTTTTTLLLILILLLLLLLLLLLCFIVQKLRDGTPQVQIRKRLFVPILVNYITLLALHATVSFCHNICTSSDKFWAKNSIKLPVLNIQFRLYPCTCKYLWFFQA